MLIEKEELASLVPHKGSMLLLTGAREYNLEERSISTVCHITEDCIFYDPEIGAVPSWVGFELMAQSISVLSGIRDRLLGKKPKFGFIMSVSSMSIGIPFFKAGSTVEIKVKERDAIEVVYNFGGEIFLDGKQVMEGKLTVMDASEEMLKALRA